MKKKWYRTPTLHEKIVIRKKKNHYILFDLYFLAYFITFFGLFFTAFFPFQSARVFFKFDIGFKILFIRILLLILLLLLHMKICTQYNSCLHIYWILLLLQHHQQHFLTCSYMCQTNM